MPSRYTSGHARDEHPRPVLRRVPRGAGEKIPERKKVLLLLASANRDPRHWEAPERFDIARMEGELVLSALAERVARIELDGEPERELKNNLRGLERLPLRVVAV